MSEIDHDEFDAVAAALGRRAEEREQTERAPEWEAVARGELSVEAAIDQRRDLENESESVEDLERAAAYFRPFDPDETAALVDSLLTHTKLPEAGADVVPLNPAKPAHDPATSGLWWMPAGLLVAAAAAIVLWWVVPPGDDVRRLTDGGGEKIAKVEPLPNYVLETDGGLRHLRGDDDGGEPANARLEYGQATVFEWVLRPKVDSAQAVGVRGFVFVDGGSAGLPLDLRELVQVAESGAIRVAGTIEQLGLEPGRYTIALVVGRVDGLPEQAGALSELSADPGWQLSRIDVVIDG